MGFFDSPGEKLYKEMDRAVNDLMSVSSAIKGEIIAKTQALIPRLQQEAVRWSNEGKLKAARNLQKAAKQRRDFDIADYVSLYFAGAHQEASLLPDDPHAQHVKQTIETLLSNELETQKPSASRQTQKAYELIAMCLVIPISIHYGRAGDSLGEFLRDIESDKKDIAWRIYCLAYGIVDALSQLRGISQTEHLALATMFFATEMNKSIEEATHIVGRLIKITPDAPLFRLIYQGGLAVSKYSDSEDLAEFYNLADLLSE
ncbi:MAG: hypothetical protein U1A72_02875 [Sulfuritalea sp.]|nr:hypothetical protein [Sulfuritalea sp.]